MKKIFPGFFLMAAGILAINLSSQAADKPLTGRQIMVMVDERPDGDDRKAVMTMELINRKNRKRVRTILSYSKDYGKDIKTLMYFQKPADVKGTGFLSWEYDDPERDDDRWLYLPALKKVRRISGKSKNEYFMGSDFTYDDLGDRSVDEDTHRLLREESINGFDCWVIESIPVDPDDMYTKKIIWICKHGLIAVKAEYYDREGLLKIFAAHDIKQQNGFWTIFRTEMENIPEKHKTIMKIEEIHYNAGLKDSLFRVSKLQRGNLK